MKNHHPQTTAVAAGVLCLHLTTSLFAATDIGTLTKGVRTYGGPPGCPALSFWGYATGLEGSYSPAGLTGGRTLTAAEDFGCGPVSSHITVDGFSSDPGSTWLTSVTCNGVARLATAASYSYSGSTAFWQWAGATFGLAFLANGANTSCSITHN